MPYRPDEIGRKVFLTTLRGYDRQEVDVFLRAVAEDYAEALEAAAAVGVSPAAPEAARRGVRSPTSLDLSLVLRSADGGLTLVARQPPEGAAGVAQTEVGRLCALLVSTQRSVDELSERLRAAQTAGPPD